MTPIPLLRRVTANPIVWIGMGVLCTLLDRWSGPRIHFPIAYVIPVALSAWHRGLHWAWPLSAAFALMRLGLFPHHEASGGWAILIVNAAVRAVSLALLAWLIHHTAHLRRHIQTLEGMLPICAWCKRIRTEQGEWLSLETLVAQNADVAFTHGICPDCTERFRAEADARTP